MDLTTSNEQLHQLITSELSEIGLSQGYVNIAALGGLLHSSWHGTNRIDDAYFFRDGSLPMKLGEFMFGISIPKVEVHAGIEHYTIDDMLVLVNGLRIPFTRVSGAIYKAQQLPVRAIHFWNEFPIVDKEPGEELTGEGAHYISRHPLLSVDRLPTTPSAFSQQLRRSIPEIKLAIYSRH
jgi:hypothetical protein